MLKIHSLFLITKCEKNKKHFLPIKFANKNSKMHMTLLQVLYKLLTHLMFTTLRSSKIIVW